MASEEPNYTSRSIVLGSGDAESASTSSAAAAVPLEPASDSIQVVLPFGEPAGNDEEPREADTEAIVRLPVPASQSSLLIPHHTIVEGQETLARDDQEYFGDDIFTAFARFLQIEVANGDATDDTVRAYYREVDLWTRWCERHHLRPAEARRIHIEMYREEMKQAGLHVTTRSHKLSIVRRFYDAAVRAGLREDNPAAGVRGGKDLTPGEEKIKALTSGALMRLLEAVPGDSLIGRRDRAIIALMAVHGLRRVEVERLNEESLLIEGDTASVEVRGKGNRMRRVFLRPDTYAALTNYLNFKHDSGYAVGGPCFVSFSNRSRGERISRRSLNDIIDRYLNAALLKRAGVSCHALRHTFGTLAVAGGAKVEHLRDAMGHQRLETTGLYVKAVERVKNNPANFIDIEI